MAQIQLQPAEAGKRNSVRRSHIRIDMTPMVDLGFLLITFFIITTTMAGAKTVTDLYVPAGEHETSNVGESTALTILLAGGDTVYYYHGNWDAALKNKQVMASSFDVQKGIGNVIRNKQKALGHKSAELTLMIKPNERSTYNNLMKVLDEVLISQVKKYAIMDLTVGEHSILNKSTGLQ